MNGHQETLTQNFEIVRGKYGQAASDQIPAAELDEVSLRVVLYYFYLYNSWRGIYEKEKNRDLAFREEDFEHPYTRDQILQFFKNRYPGDYIGKSAALLGMSAEALRTYESNRDSFYDSFR